MHTLRIDEYLGRRMRRRRRLLGMTLGGLGGRCGLSFKQIHKYETGANAVSAAQLWRLAAGLDVPVTYFFDGLAEAHDQSAAEETQMLAVIMALAPSDRGAILRAARELAAEDEAAAA